jgi:hypothetical protein
MKIIQDNPYRIAGILAGASQRDIERQKSKITKYVGVGKEVDSELDFSFLNKANRSKDTIDKAFSGIEQNQDKMVYSLFWFIKANPFDNTAINYLINGNKEKALEIWEKVTNGKDVTAKNFSCFNNIGTLKLLGSSKEEIEEGIEAKIKLIESENFADFALIVADQTYTINNQKQAERFIDELLLQFQDDYSGTEIFSFFSNCNGITQKYISQKFTEEPIHNIERLIEAIKSSRKVDKLNAYNLGIDLYSNSKEDLVALKAILGINDLKYKMIADNLAKEVMQCGIDYFNAMKETSNPGNESLRLLKYANSIATGSQTKERIRENIESMQEWVEMAPIKADIDYIANKIKAFQDKATTIENVQSLINNCKNRLLKIRNVLGSTDEFYLRISDAVVNNALGMLIEVVNDAQSGLEYNQAKVIRLPRILSNAVSVMDLMDSFDMDSQMRERFNQNKTTINRINQQFEELRSRVHSSRTSSSDSSGGCYIATMAYGDYNHPQVMKLRYFRDHYLNRYVIGRHFIKLYYRYSPGFVRKLKNKQKVNDVIRHVLDQLIKIIKK